MSGVAYGSTRIAAGKVQQVLNWPGTQDTYRKIPTCLLYDQNGRVLAWGIEAKSNGPIPGTYKCEWVSPPFMTKIFVTHHLRLSLNCTLSLPYFGTREASTLVYHLYQ
jgi:hypothetical protein